MKYTSDKSELPSAPHFAALVFESIHIPGDERSRTHPGHGYPNSTESVVKYISFVSREEMEKWVSERETSPYGRKDNYKIIEAFPRTVRLKVAVE